MATDDAKDNTGVVNAIELAVTDPEVRQGEIARRLALKRLTPPDPDQHLGDTTKSPEDALLEATIEVDSYKVVEQLAEFIVSQRTRYGRWYAVIQLLIQVHHLGRGILDNTDGDIVKSCG